MVRIPFARTRLRIFNTIAQCEKERNEKACIECRNANFTSSLTRVYSGRDANWPLEK